MIDLRTTDQEGRAIIWPLTLKRSSSLFEDQKTWSWLQTFQQAIHHIPIHQSKTVTKLKFPIRAHHNPHHHIDRVYHTKFSHAGKEGQPTQFTSTLACSPHLLLIVGWVNLGMAGVSEWGLGMRRFCGHVPDTDHVVWRGGRRRRWRGTIADHSTLSGRAVNSKSVWVCTVETELAEGPSLDLFIPSYHTLVKSRPSNTYNTEFIV